ncbi:SRPBCC family protein [Larkinella rosea]|uniref:ATPase n=1 Tax=Larkinella rosea TaxID=2025312 RepID=A0A3P1BV40_9BACT|nr:SRPBCC family protein [Larkinella rosea]RRB04769.1 ATPase [Larkinella rosea]
METPEILRTSPECEIVTTRVLAFPRQLVYRAWTEPEHLKNWWGPNGFTNTFHLFDFRVGGRWLFTMHGPEKGNYPNECTFLVIREPERLVWNRQSKPLFQVEVLFDEIAEKETRVTFKQQFETEEECNKLRKFVPEKNEENMDRLENELAKMS